MTGRRLIYLASLAGCLVFYYFYREWLSWLFLMCVVFLPWLSLLLSLPMIATLRSKLTLPATVPLGQECRASAELHCDFPVPFFRCRFRVTHAITGERKTLRSSQSLPTHVCGILKVEPVRVGVYDYLGLFWLPVKKIPETTVCIWPDQVPVVPTPDFAVQPPRRWKPKQGGGFSENHDLRLYRPGDNLQQIHWKLSAKTGKLILREAIVPDHQILSLSLDLSGSPEVLNRKLGRLLWLGSLLVEKGRPYNISALTGKGVLTWQVDSESAMIAAITQLLGAPAAESGTLEGVQAYAGRTYRIGGEPDEE